MPTGWQLIFHSDGGSANLWMASRIQCMAHKVFESPSRVKLPPHRLGD